jgi:SAM-dependent methyltransferase
MKTISNEWWRDFKSHYPRYANRLNECGAVFTQTEAKKFIKFIKKHVNMDASANTLDLCCGLGSYSIELARQGFNVVGLDINLVFIDNARRNAKMLLGDLGRNVQFVFGDMRSIPFNNRFDCVINVGTSFGFFDREEDNYQVVKEIAKSLKPKGTFLLDVGNRDWYLKNLLYKDWFRNEDGTVTLMERRFDYDRSRLTVTFESIGGTKKEAWSSSWRAYTLTETINIFEKAGLAVSKVFGDWDDGEFNVDSKRMVIVSNKID